MTQQGTPITPKSPWLKVLIVFSVPIVVYLAVGVYYTGFADRRYCRQEAGFFRRLLCGSSVFYEAHAPYFRSLPSDKEMISHFYGHKEDFERLVRIYREDLSVPADRAGLLLPTPRVKELMNRIGVTAVDCDGMVWLPPDPYSNKPDVVKRIARLRTAGSGERRRFTGVVLAYGHPPVKRFRYLVPVYKGYYYTPFSPQVEGRRMWTPNGAEWILATLNKYPPRMDFCECFYRRIEAHWFIRMCRDG